MHFMDAQCIPWLQKQKTKLEKNNRPRKEKMNNPQAEPDSIYHSGKTTVGTPTLNHPFFAIGFPRFVKTKVP
jgi:hypothetical protein